MFLFQNEFYCKIRYTQLPYTVRAFTLYDAVDDFYNIYVNENLSDVAQKIAIKHELQHIKNGDFHANGDSVSDIEHRMHA